MSKLDRKHWSYSSLNQFIRCPLQFYFERVLKLPRASIPSNMVLGSALHHALEHYHHAIKRGEGISFERLQLKVLQCWQDREAQQKIQYKYNEDRQHCVDQAIELLHLYVQEPPPEKILWIEQPFWVPLQNSSGHYLDTPLLAIADLVTAKGFQWKVSEFKTAARAYGEFEINSSLQATCYAHAVWENFATTTNIEFVLFIKTKAPKIQRFGTERSDKNFRRLGDLVETIESAVEHQLFYPNENPLNCSSCPYRSQCLQWQPDRQITELKLPQLSEPLEECACSRS